MVGARRGTGRGRGSGNGPGSSERMRGAADGRFEGSVSKRQGGVIRSGLYEGCRKK